MCFCLGKNTIYSKYSTNTNETSIKVDGWRNYSKDNNITVDYNDSFVRILFHSSSWNAGTQWFETNLINDNNLKPAVACASLSWTGNIIVRILDNSGKLGVKSTASSSVTESLYATIIYPIQ